MMKSPKIILRYVLGLVGVFGLSFALLVGLHFSFMDRLALFERELENERSRIAIGEAIITNINQVERHFYQVLTTFAGSTGVDKICAVSEVFFTNIEQAFAVFNNGGSLTVTTRINKEGLEDFTRTITYVPKAKGEYELEIIDIRPKVQEIRARMQSLAALVAKRNSLISTGEQAALDAVRQDILIFLKNSPAHFVRLYENANGLYYQGHKNLEQLKGEIARRTSYYNTIATGFNAAIISLVLFICWRIARQIYAVHRHLDFVSREMETAKKQAEAANKIKTDFLATMSHEVRTPLNIIIGMTGLALETTLTPAQQRYLHRIQSAGEILLGLMNDILDFSKIEEGKLEFGEQPFDLKEIIHAVAEVVKVAATKKGIAVEAFAADGPWIAKGDPVRLRQILLILASNAVKFTQKGRVVIQGRLEELGPHRLLAVVSVRDTGIGIAKEQLATIFDTFVQADTSVTRKYGGTGLGLAICHQLAKLMGGEITVESEVGQGTIFSLSLPMLKGSSPRGQQVPRRDERALATGPDRTFEILLVDGDGDQQEIARALLEQAGQRVKRVDDGLEALRCLAKFQYDVVFLALHMPVLAGREVARDIRAFERGEAVNRQELGYDLDWLAARLNGQHTFLVAVSADPQQAQQHAGDEGLFDEHICKPYLQKELVDLLTRLGRPG